MSWSNPICYLFQLAVILNLNSAVSSATPKHIPLTLGVESKIQKLPCFEWKYYMVEVTEPCKDLNVKVLNQNGEPDVYVSRGSTKYPTDNHLAWSSYNWGSENLTISSWDPEFTVGTYYIGVHAYCGIDVSTGDTDARYTVLVSSIRSSHPHEEIGLNGAVSDRLTRESYKYFRFCIPDTCVNVEVKLDNCLDPTSCPESYSWPELLVSRSITHPTINDHSWKLASIDRRSVYIEYDDPEFYPGHYFVGVYGWCTPDEECPDPATCGPCHNYPAGFSVSVIADVIVSGCVAKQPLGLCEVVPYNGGGFVKVSALGLVVSSIMTILL